LELVVAADKLNMRELPAPLPAFSVRAGTFQPVCYTVATAVLLRQFEPRRQSVAQRLVESYRMNDPVEVFVQNEEGDEWRPARIVALQHPGVWVLTEDHRLWFVTNGKRIRPTVLPAPSH
jgi:hypothetical protein